MTLDNDRALSAQHGVGYYRRHCQRITSRCTCVSVDGVPNYSRVFTGVLKIPSELGATSRQHPTVTFDCRSWDEVILQQRVSTLQSIFSTIYTSGYTEEQIIARWLTDAGMNDGVEFTSQAFGGTPTLDPGLWIINWAWLDDESPMTDIWQLAAAAGGRFYADPDGVFRYEMPHWFYSPHTVSQATLIKDNFVPDPLVRRSGIAQSRGGSFRNFWTRR